MSPKALNQFANAPIAYVNAKPGYQGNAYPPGVLPMEEFMASNELAQQQFIDSSFLNS